MLKILLPLALAALSVLAILISSGCQGRRHFSIDYVYPWEPTEVYYSNRPHPPIRMTFSQGVNHMEPQDEQQVEHAIFKCVEFFGEGSFPLRIKKTGAQDYQTVCGSGSSGSSGEGTQ